MKPQARKVETLYWLGDIVYLRVAGKECKGMITAVAIMDCGTKYEVSWPAETDWRHAMELTTEYVPDYVSEASGG